MHSRINSVTVNEGVIYGDDEVDMILLGRAALTSVSQHHDSSKPSSQTVGVLSLPRRQH